MEITTLTLMLYFCRLDIFSIFAISHYIARLSKEKWVDWAKSTESDEDLLIILDPIVNEIEDRMHDKLEAFQARFWIVGAASKNLTKPQAKVQSKR